MTTTPKLTVMSGEKVAKAFQKIGYKVVRQRGSHLRLKDKEHPSHKSLTIPLHKELKPGLLRKLTRDANISLEEFLGLL